MDRAATGRRPLVRCAARRLDGVSRPRHAAKGLPQPARGGQGRLPGVAAMAKDPKEMTGPAARHTDVVIAGGGLAGSLSAAMLGRAGINAMLVDPHPVYPPDFRCEKLDGAQLQTLQLTGLADA